MRLETAQIVQSAQVWVCDTCGGHDNKSCGCNSSAHMEAMKAAAAKHADRNERERQRIKAKRAAAVGNADIENIEQSPQASADAMRARFAEMEDDPAAEAENEEGLRVIAARAVFNRAKEARQLADVGEVQTSDVTDLMIEAADEAASAWKMAAQKLRRMLYGEK